MKRRRMGQLPPQAPPAGHVYVTEQLAADGFTTLHEDATAETWIANDRVTGQKRAIKVVDMSDGHLVRWVQYFRRKHERHQPTLSAVDGMIRALYVTATAIYTEIDKRGLRGLIDPTAPLPVASPAPVRARVVTPEPGQRLITLKD